MPEWGIILTGVLLAKYDKKFPQDADTEIETLCSSLLHYAEANAVILPSGRAAAKVLLCVWRSRFPNGLDPVLRAAFASWPSTEALSGLSNKEVEECLVDIEKSLPISMSDHERRYYRLYMERNGAWPAMEKLSFR
jgi:hypothetical protein